VQSYGFLKLPNIELMKKHFETVLAYLNSSMRCKSDFILKTLLIILKITNKLKITEASIFLTNFCRFWMIVSEQSEQIEIHSTNVNHNLQHLLPFDTKSPLNGFG